MREVGTVWAQRTPWYAGLRERHPDLWKFIPEWIEQEGITEVIEIGGGDGYVSTFLPPGSRYINIELHEPERVVMEEPLGVDVQRITGDFMEMDLTPFRLSMGEQCALFALAVIEHNESAEMFLDRCLLVAPKKMIVSFFRGLKRKTDKIVRREYDDGGKPFISAPGGVYWENFYSLKTIEGWMEKRGVADKCRVIPVGRDTLLLMGEEYCSQSS